MPKTSNPKVVSKKHLARLEKERIQTRNITIASAAVLVVVLSLIAYAILDQKVFQDRKAVAQVGKDRITLGEFKTQVKFSRQQLINQYQTYAQYAQLFSSDQSYGSYFQSYMDQISTQLNDSQVMGSQVIDSMVDDLLIRQEAKRRGITVSQEEIDTKMQEEFGYYVNGTPTPASTSTPVATSTLSAMQMTLVPPTATPTLTPTATSGPTATPTAGPSPTPTATTPPPTATPAGSPTPTITPTPGPTSTPYTFEGFKTQVSTYLDSMSSLGFTEKDLRKMIESQLYYDKVKAAITADLKPEQEQVWARHILVADEATAQAAKARLEEGADFATLAAELSTDTSNKDQGGDLGWFARGKMVAEFEDVAFSLKVGEISDPVKTEFGYHIIQVLGHEVRPLDDTGFSDYKDSVFTKWLDEQNTQDTIKRFDVWQDVVPTEPALNTTGA